LIEAKAIDDAGLRPPAATACRLKKHCINASARDVECGDQAAKAASNDCDFILGHARLSLPHHWTRAYRI